MIELIALVAASLGYTYSFFQLGRLFSKESTASEERGVSSTLALLVAFLGPAIICGVSRAWIAQTIVAYICAPPPPPSRVEGAWVALQLLYNLSGFVKDLLVEVLLKSIALGFIQFTNHYYLLPVILGGVAGFSFLSGTQDRQTNTLGHSPPPLQKGICAAMGAMLGGAIGVVGGFVAMIGLVVIGWWIGLILIAFGVPAKSFDYVFYVVVASCCLLGAIMGGRIGYELSD